MLVLAMIITTLSIQCYCIARTSATKADVMYKASGSYYIAPSQLRVVDEDMSVTYDDEKITLNYHMTSLPYDINVSRLYLTDAERQAGHLIPETSVVLSTRKADIDPFKTYFGCDVVSSTITTDEYTATFTWHAYNGILLEGEISKAHEIQTVFRLSYKSSTIDLYAGYDPTYIREAEMFKFIFSPAGLVILAIPLVLIVVFACYIFNTRKKLRSNTRGGRFLTG